MLIGNNAVRSDEALHSFYATMKQLYDKKYWWVGHYNENISKAFLKITDAYLNDLIQYKPEFLLVLSGEYQFKDGLKIGR